MEEMNYFGFENGDEYEIADKKAREGVDKLNSNLVSLAYGEYGAKNILDVKKEYYKHSDGVLTVSGNKVTVTGKWYCYYLVNVKKNTDYFLSGNVESATITSDINIYDKTLSTSIKNSARNTTFNTGNNDVISILLYSGNNTSGTTVFSNLMLEEGSVATQYEPYIPSVKMLADEVDNVNESLNAQGLLNKFDGQYKQGAYSTANGTWSDLISAISNTNKIYCKSGDIIDLKYSSSITYLFIEFFNGNDEFISSKVVDNASELRETAPENTSYIRFGIQVNGTLTPDTAGKTIVYVNNAIDELKNDLVPKKIELQNVDERVTIQDNGSFIINGFAFVNLLVTFNETLPQWSNFVRLPRPKGDTISVHCENSVILVIYSQDNLPGDCGTTENVASGTEIRLLVNYEVA